MIEPTKIPPPPTLVNRYLLVHSVGILTLILLTLNGVISQASFWLGMWVLSWLGNAVFAAESRILYRTILFLFDITGRAALLINSQHEELSKLRKEHEPWRES